jgi:CheY-like chemotaxis protein
MALGDKQAAVAALPLGGKRILVVEDQAFIALEMQDYLERAGAAVAGPVGRLDRAVKSAGEEHLDAAVLDIDLNGERCWPVADVLALRAIPFAFTTGFEASIVVPERFKDAPLLSKPYREKAVVSVLWKLLG